MASNRLRSAKGAEGDDLAIDMSPMIDMVFLLLIFFLVNASMIIVKQDENVTPPVASHAKEATSGKGRIVINIYEDGEYFSEGGLKLESDEAIFDLVKKEKELVDQLGYDPSLHLRGDKNAVFKHCRKVIRISARAGVEQVIFSSYPFELN